MPVLSRLLLSFCMVLFSQSSHAACTLDTAQNKMIEVTNMMQVYNRKNIDYTEAGGAPATFTEKFHGFVDKSNAMGIALSNETEKNANIQPNDPIDQSVCDGYDELFETYAPDGYSKAPIKKQQTSTTTANCDTNSLWTKYGDLIQKQVALFQAGKFTDAEDADLRRLSTEIGQASTTDIDKACTLLDEFEGKINAK